MNTKKIPWIVSEIIEATNGKLFSGNIDHKFTGVSIDSRNISQNDLFVAIKGDTHDGHNFIQQIVDKGIQGIVIDQKKINELSVEKYKKQGVVCIGVKDTIWSLGDLATYNRNRSNVKLVAITGSNGKTTTKEMTFSVVSQRFNTLGTFGNLNNNIGVPLTLLSLNPEHEVAVLELGMNHAGEIRRLSEICRPDIGVITNIGPAHLEGLGSIENVAKAKGELLENIKPNGTVILNADDPRVWKLSENIKNKVISFGVSENTTVRSINIEPLESGTFFTLMLPDQRIDVKLSIPGKFMVSNALAAAAVGYELGLSADDIKTGLEKFKPVHGRLNILKLGKITVIDDTYNANPGSMTAALATFESLKANNRGIFVAGDMFELGDHSALEHENIGSLCVSRGITRLYTTGKFAENMALGAKKQGLGKSDIFIGKKDEILEDLKKYIMPDDWILVKGSRAMKMETIVQGLKGQ